MVRDRSLIGSCMTTDDAADWLVVLAIIIGFNIIILYYIIVFFGQCVDNLVFSELNETYINTFRATCLSI